jgi:LysW-gamma-L-alpha-aminoadipyl-6-phosphate/LysW-L-glutamyl-5-phosphate reductase
VLAAEQSVEVTSVVSSSQVGAAVADVHPHLRGFYDLHLTGAVDHDRLLGGEHAVIISALPHGTSARTIAALLEELEQHARGRAARVIDMSGDFRLSDAALHARHYPESPVLPDLRPAFVYGQPELWPERVRSARLVSNPGCLATAAILALAPLAQATLTGPLAIDAKTGSSGSGRQLKETTHHPTRHADVRAYKPLAHQHEPEILQALGDPHGERLQLSFVAQSLDVARGIFVTAHLTLADPIDSATLKRQYEAFYANRPFVRIVDDSPALQNVVGSNFCDIALACRGRQVVVIAALDNLVKGMAGTAIQNLNLMCGLPETTGLWAPALRPV